MMDLQGHSGILDILAVHLYEIPDIMRSLCSGRRSSRSVLKDGRKPLSCYVSSYSQDSRTKIKP